MLVQGRLLVLYGSQTFTAQEIAEKLWRITKALGFSGPVQAMDDYSITTLIREDLALFVCATTGNGDEPDNMKNFWKFLLRRNLPNNSLMRLKFGVLGLGDSSYAKFNFIGKKLHKRLVQLGATPLVDVGLCDYQHDVGHDAVMTPWTKKFFSTLKTYFPNIEPDTVNNKFIPRWHVTLLKEKKPSNGDSLKISQDIYFGKGYKDKFYEPILLESESNLRTTDESHFQDVRLITFVTKKGQTLDYKPGDIFNIRPRNSKEDIDDLFEIFHTHKMDIQPHHLLLVEECHEDMPVPDFLKEPLTIHEIAEQYWDLKFIPTQYVFSLLALVSEDTLERDKCIELSTAEGQEEWLNYCRRPRRTVLEVLQDFHKSTSKLTLPILFELFSPIKPRSFSIASSCLASPSKLEILVAAVKYYSKLKKARLGLCSNWLVGLGEGVRVFGWIKKGTFVFPNEHTPQILIGPGTGLAPFRSHILEQQATASLRHLHLYFGCRYKERDFHCREEMERWRESGLKLVCAFSRDQDEKIYVQHKVAETREILWPLITNNGEVFISGNAKNMPDNVKSAFIEDVFMKTGQMSEDEAKSMMKRMEDGGRWQTETW